MSVHCGRLIQVYSLAGCAVNRRPGLVRQTQVCRMAVLCADDTIVGSVIGAVTKPLCTARPWVPRRSLFGRLASETARSVRHIHRDDGSRMAHRVAEIRCLVSLCSLTATGQCMIRPVTGLAPIHSWAVDAATDAGMGPT